MRIEYVENQILKGRDSRERPADILYMCHAVAISRLAHHEDYEVDDPPFPMSLTSRTGKHARLLFGAGVILCPIFQPVKHVRYQEYSDQMTQARLNFVGIATDPRLKRDFGESVEAGIEMGAFTSLEAANEVRLWKLFGPRDTMEATDAQNPAPY